jgi:type II secretory ATPase GspE/PulE/Tfp pilus assembly ATPase PilB-like protein
MSSEGFLIPKLVATEGTDALEAKPAAILLKSLLRATPNVILFGEIRKSDIARELIDAADNDHSVSATYHVASSASAVSCIKGI